MNKRHAVLLFAVVLVAFILRFYKLGENPPSLSWDEASLGYNAYSILQTARDEHGNFIPISNFPAFGDYKPPGYIYATVPFIWLFGLNEFSVRVPSALAGVLTVIVTYFLVGELFQRTKLKFRLSSLQFLSSLLLAISPWHLNLSRAGFEANLALLFIVTGIYFFIRYMEPHGQSPWFQPKRPNGANIPYQKTNSSTGRTRGFLGTGINNLRNLYDDRHSFFTILFSLIFFVLSLYTFNSARIFVPLFGLLLLLIFYKDLIRVKKDIFLATILAIVLFLPLIPHLLSPEGKLRFKEVNIYTDLEPIKISNSRQEIDGYSWWSRILHNRRILFAVNTAKHYFDNLDPKFLFISGDGNPKFSTQDVGQLYLWSLPFLIAGLYYLTKDKKRFWYIPISWLIIGIAPAAVARETPHALRIENSLPAWQIIIAYGFLQTANSKKQIAKRAFDFVTEKQLRIFVICFLLFLNIVFYLHSYYFYYPIEFAGNWQWGYREAIDFVKTIEGKYDVVRVSESIGRPYIYFLFYKAYSPNQYLKTVDRTGDPFGFFHVHSFDKYVFGEFKKYNNKKTLYVYPPNDVPETANILDYVKYPNGEVALVIFDLL